IAAQARALLARANLREPVRLLGVGVTGLRASDTDQLALFGPDAEAQRRARLNRALDAIAERFGSGAVSRGDRGAAERAGLSLQIKRGESPD
ncbi:MAG: DNA polymerase IV, partial [Deltaproteobacteria bacterium]